MFLFDNLFLSYIILFIMEYIFNYMLVNSIITPVSEYDKKGNVTIYEVIRIIDGVPLYLENHLQRLVASANKINKSVPYSKSQFKELIDKLITSIKVFSGNIKISLNYSDTTLECQTVIAFIPHKYPSQIEYSEGVDTVTSIDQRVNPGVKMQDDILRNKFNNLLQIQNVYEVILVHPDGYITEGSRSNIFFIKGDTIETSPDEIVLPGITREFIIKICRENNYDINFNYIPYSGISKFDAAFITGTSPKVLPIKRIDKHLYNLPNKIIENISHKYDDFILSYLATHQKIN